MPLRLIADQNVPESVVTFLIDRGHEVRRARDLSLADAPDEILAAVGDRWKAIVVTWDKDLTALASRIPTGNRIRFRRLGRITFRCRESQGRNRLEQVIELIEAAHAMAQQRPDKRLLVVINDANVRFDL